MNMAPTRAEPLPSAVLCAIHVDGDTKAASELLAPDLAEHSGTAPLRAETVTAMPNSFAPRYVFADNGLVVVISDVTKAGT